MAKSAYQPQTAEQQSTSAYNRLYRAALVALGLGMASLPGCAVYSDFGMHAEVGVRSPARPKCRPVEVQRQVPSTSIDVKVIIEKGPCALDKNGIPQ